MGFVYALFHVTYTIPPAILLTLLYRPLFTKLDLYRIAFLITIAVASTIPWDSYLIRNNIWSYPDYVIIGPTLFKIPLEEVFFFIIQTYNTSLLYIILSRPTFQPVYLRARGPGISSAWHFRSFLGQLALLGVIGWGWCLVKANGLGTYTGLIIVWAGPFVLFLWSLAYQFILGLPLSNTAIPIMIPTLYLWIIDTIALNRGTWVITTGTKYGVHLWDGLDIEEALFFLVTNTMIVFGQLAFDNALSIVYTTPSLNSKAGPSPSPLTLIQALLLPASSYDQAHLTGLEEAVDRLKRKSRSFYLASFAFQGQLRTDLLLLYSFCRVADDLVDNATSTTEAQASIKKLHTFLDIVYTQKTSPATLSAYVTANFPRSTHSALLQLPSTKLSRQPLQDLLHGFETDLAFNSTRPIHEEADLSLYAERVAGTVAQMCIELIYHIYPHPDTSPELQKHILAAGNRMGIALQYVNVARDISVDAKIGRVYLPGAWLEDVGLSYESVLNDPSGPLIESLRSRLLDKAFSVYEGARAAIEGLPGDAKGPIRVAVESYMEIGRVLRREGYVIKAGRATVPRARRMIVAWRTLNR